MNSNKKDRSTHEPGPTGASSGGRRGSRHVDTARPTDAPAAARAPAASPRRCGAGTGSSLPALAPPPTPWRQLPRLGAPAAGWGSSAPEGVRLRGAGCGAEERPLAGPHGAAGRLRLPGLVAGWPAAGRGAAECSPLSNGLGGEGGPLAREAVAASGPPSHHVKARQPEHTWARHIALPPPPACSRRLRAAPGAAPGARTWRATRDVGARARPGAPVADVAYQPACRSAMLGAAAVQPSLSSTLRVGAIAVAVAWGPPSGQQAYFVLLAKPIRPVSARLKRLSPAARHLAHQPRGRGRRSTPRDWTSSSGRASRTRCGSGRTWSSAWSRSSSCRACTCARQTGGWR